MTVVPPELVPLEEPRAARRPGADREGRSHLGWDLAVPAGTLLEEPKGARYQPWPGGQALVWPVPGPTTYYLLAGPVAQKPLATRPYPGGSELLHLEGWAGRAPPRTRAERMSWRNGALPPELVTSWAKLRELLTRTTSSPSSPSTSSTSSPSSPSTSSTSSTSSPSTSSPSTSSPSTRPPAFVAALSVAALLLLAAVGSVVATRRRGPEEESEAALRREYRRAVGAPPPPRASAAALRARIAQSGSLGRLE